MNGPRIIRIENPEPTHKPRVKRDRSTGIRKAANGEWSAIRDGRLIGDYGKGINGRRVASRVAGTSEVI